MLSPAGPFYGGSALADVTFPGDGVQVVVLRPKTHEPLEADSSRTGDVEALSVQLDESVIKSRVVETVTQAAEGIRLEDAAIVVRRWQRPGRPRGI